MSLSKKSSKKQVGGAEKKTSKKSSKKSSKPRKIDKDGKVIKSKKKSVKKKKLYCGINEPVPKGFRLGSMQECFNAKKVMYYGIKKIDNNILNSKKMKEKALMDIDALRTKVSGLMGSLNRIKKQYQRSDDPEEKVKLKKEYDNLVQEINGITELIKKSKEKNT
jgi:hypothetical protein